MNGPVCATGPLRARATSRSADPDWDSWVTADDDGGMRRPKFTPVAALGLVLALLFGPTVAAAASPVDHTPSPSPATEGEPPSTTEAPPAPEIIPKPNSGVAPTDSGDRGGGLQTAVFVLVMGGTASIAFLVWRQSKKARAERGF